MLIPSLITLTLSALIALPTAAADAAMECVLHPGIFTCEHVFTGKYTRMEQTEQAPDRKPDTKPEAFKPGEWKNLFDGKSLDGWKQTNFSGSGEVHLEKKFRNGQAVILVESGVALSGFNWTGDATIPKTDYEVALEVMKIDGSDFMCGLTFPVGDSHASLILGGWGGGTVGISSVDGLDASQNETTQYMGFPKDRWYKVRVRVTPKKIEAWLDSKQIVNLDITGKKISLRRGEIDRSIPLGISTYQTSAAFRAIKLRKLEAK